MVPEVSDDYGIILLFFLNIFSFQGAEMPSTQGNIDMFKLRHILLLIKRAFAIIILFYMDIK